MLGTRHSLNGADQASFTLVLTINGDPPQDATLSAVSSAIPFLRGYSASPSKGTSSAV